MKNYKSQIIDGVLVVTTRKRGDEVVVGLVDAMVDILSDDPND